MIRIIAIGKRHDSQLAAAIEGYQKRLKPPYDAEWLLLPHSSLEGEAARHEESKRILDKLAPDDYVVVLDERGSLLTNDTLQQLLEAPLRASQRIVLVIGWAYGVNAALQRRAARVWSLSPLVFPHQLVRLLVIEQLYRSYTLAQGHPYHHS